jgi:hypothetical protein
MIYSCSEGFYFDDQSLICKKCLNFCANCSSSSVCSQCNAGYFINANGLC